MMYNEKLAVAIKSNGKVLREFKDTVYVAFGSEYAITIKNLNTVRALVHVFVDGKNTTPDGLVIGVGQSIDYERSLANGSLTTGNKFKFIERTSAIEKHRGIDVEDGIVRVEYQFEKVYQPSITWTAPLYQYPTWTETSFGPGIIGTSSMAKLPLGGILRNSTYTTSNAVSGATLSDASGDFLQAQNMVQNVVQNDAGITVEGSKSNQSFTTVSSFSLEPAKHSIVLKLLGETPDNKPVVKNVTVKTKPRCKTCGHQNKATAKFCTHCGTSLEIYA